MALYQGEAFDQASFFEWYDVHHDGAEHGPDGSLDLREFGWYIADCAGCVEASMPAVITAFSEAIDYIKSKDRESQRLQTSRSRKSLLTLLSRNVSSKLLLSSKLLGRRSRSV